MNESASSWGPSGWKAGLVAFDNTVSATNGRQRNGCTVSIAAAWEGSTNGEVASYLR